MSQSRHDVVSLTRTPDVGQRSGRPDGRADDSNGAVEPVTVARVSGTAVTSLIVSAVYAYVAVYFALLFRTRRHDREYLHFAVFVGLLAAATAANSVLFSGVVPFGVAALAMNVSVTSIVLASAAFVHLMQALVARPWPRLSQVTLLWCTLTVVATGAGLVTDASRARATAIGSGLFPLIPFTGIGSVLLGGCTTLAGISAARTMFSDVQEREARLVALGSIPAVLTAAHDVLYGAGVVSTFFLFQYGALFFVAAMGHLLLRRFLRTHEELEQRTEEIRRGLGQQRQAQKALLRKEQLAAVGRLSSMIAHEVRNPLAVLQSALASLGKPTLKAAYRETLLDIVLEESQRLSRLAEDLVTYANPRSSVAMPFDPAEVVRSVLDGVRERGVDAGIRIEAHLEGAPDRMDGDAQAVGRALDNLVDNALQAMSGHGTLTLAVTTEGEEWVLFTVRDTGEGMDTLVRSRARDPFFSTRPTGTGLGLAIVERVAKEHGGTVEVTSRYGEGTTVVLRMPRRQEGAA